MNIVERVKDILLTPKTTWPVIEQEESSTAELFTQYIMILAAIQAVAGFIGMSIFGIGGFGVSIRVPIMTGLVQMALGYALALAMTYVMALIADALAPAFGGDKNPLSALKLVAYSSTAAMVGGIFALLPMVGALTLVAALYSLYLLYLGAPTLMKVPQEKALPYTAVLVVCAIVIGAVAGTVLGSVRGGPTMVSSTIPAQMPVSAPAQTQAATPTQAPAAAPAQVAIETPQGTVSIDVAKAEAWGKRMEEAGKAMEKAQQSGDPAAMELAIKEMTELQREQPMVMPNR